MDITFLIGNGFDLNLGLETSFSDFFKIYKTLPAIESRYAGKKATYTQEVFETKLQVFKKDINNDIKLWSDFEKQMGLYTDNENINDDKYLFLDILRDFRMRFSDYLNEQIYGFDYSGTTHIKQIFSESLYNFQNTFLPQDKKTIDDLFLKNRANSHITKIILFNYTNILDLLHKSLQGQSVHSHTDSNERSKLDTLQKPIHIHGTLSENMIIGVNDKTQIENKVFKEDKEICRAFIKQAVNENARDYRLPSSMECIKNSQLICIYGMSFGETDRYIWESVIEWLLGNTQRKVVIFAFERNYKPINPEETQEIIEEYQDTLLNYNTFTKDERDKKVAALRNQIIVGINTPMFKFKLPKKEKKKPSPAVTVPNVVEQISQAYQVVDKLKSSNIEEKLKQADEVLTKLNST